jgi:hypothetical protein
MADKIFSSATAPHESVWYDRYVASKAGNRKWCHGDKTITRTISDGKTVKCPRCDGTGDEPDFGPGGVMMVPNHNA